MPLPNFLIVGAAKSGTTSLSQYLDQHPDVFVCPGKEPSYFAVAGQTLPPPGAGPTKAMKKLWYSQCVTQYEEYLSLFEGARNHKAIGDASVRYLYFPEAARRISEAIPDVRVVAILREPVSRLYSHYCMNVQFQFEPLSLLEAIAAEDARRKANWGWDWHYVNVGRYAEQLTRYFDLFGREQVKVILYDEFVQKPLEVFHAVCRHIGVDDSFIPDMSTRGKVGYRPKNLALDRWLHWPRSIRPGVERFLPTRAPRSVLSVLERWNSAPIPRLHSNLRQELRGVFRDDILDLEKLLGRGVPWYA